MPASGRAPDGVRGRSGWILGGYRARHPVQLVCLPHAGGSASTYRSWLAPLAESMDVLPIQLPGRETRIATPFATDMTELVSELAEELGALGLTDVALFGHSMGAVLATKLCVALERKGTTVHQLVVSGHPGKRPEPSDPLLIVDPAAEDNDALAEAVGVLDPGARDRLAIPEFREMFLPILRADVRMLATTWWGDERVAAPITAVAGNTDPLLSEHELGRWARFTTADCAVHWLPGEHFYLAEPDNATALARILLDRLGLPDAVPCRAHRR